MSTRPRQLVLNAFFMRFGHHLAAWRHSKHTASGRPDVAYRPAVPSRRLRGFRAPSDPGIATPRNLPPRIRTRHISCQSRSPSPTESAPGYLPHRIGSGVSGFIAAFLVRLKLCKSNWSNHASAANVFRDSLVNGIQPCCLPAEKAAGQQQN